MRRFPWMFAFALVFVLFASDDAFAICQTCLHPSPTDEDCWVVDPQTDYAEYGACWEEPIYDPCGEIIGDRCQGGPPGPECNDWGWNGGGGGDGDPWNPENRDTGECSGWGGCPAQCARCF